MRICEDKNTNTPKRLKVSECAPGRVYKYVGPVRSSHNNPYRFCVKNGNKVNLFNLSTGVLCAEGTGINRPDYIELPDAYLNPNEE